MAAQMNSGRDSYGRKPRERGKWQKKWGRKMKAGKDGTNAYRRTLRARGERGDEGRIMAGRIIFRIRRAEASH